MPAIRNRLATVPAASWTIPAREIGRFRSIGTKPATITAVPQRPTHRLPNRPPGPPTECRKPAASTIEPSPMAMIASAWIPPCGPSA